MAEWIARHRAAWARKPGLRLYYEREIFDRLLSAVGARGPLLEIGAGPGFLRASRPEAPLASIDVAAGTAVDVRADAHALPFADGVFAGAVGVDVLHHFHHPATALREVARVLGPGARLALVEPWTGPAGRLFYRYLHHETCFVPADPFGAAFPPDKDPMDGNAAIPRELMVVRRMDRAGHIPDLALIRVEPFGALAYLCTGGFQRWGCPGVAIDGLCRLESRLPSRVMAAIGLRALFVLERTRA